MLLRNSQCHRYGAKNRAHECGGAPLTFPLRLLAAGMDEVEASGMPCIAASCSSDSDSEPIHALLVDCSMRGPCTLRGLSVALERSNGLPYAGRIAHRHAGSMHTGRQPTLCLSWPKQRCEPTHEPPRQKTCKLPSRQAGCKSCQAPGV